MISRHTPPGTEIMCIKDFPPFDGLPGVKKGKIYIVRKIAKSDSGESIDYGVLLVGHGCGNVRRLFRWLTPWKQLYTGRAYHPGLFRYLVFDHQTAQHDIRAPTPA